MNCWSIHWYLKIAIHENPFVLYLYLYNVQCTAIMPVGLFHALSKMGISVNVIKINAVLWYNQRFFFMLILISSTFI